MVDEGWATGIGHLGGAEIAVIGLKLGPVLLAWAWATQSQIAAFSCLAGLLDRLCGLMPDCRLPRGGRNQA